VDLTPRERQAVELRESTDPPMSYREIARTMGVTYDVARRSYQRGFDKRAIGNYQNSGGAASNEGRKLVHSQPERFADIADAATNPLPRTLKEAAEADGLSVLATQRLARKMDREYQNVGRELKRVKTETLVREFENLGLRALESITEEDLQNVNAYQRTLIAAIAIDKRELLDGRPTERISVEDRRRLPELLQMLDREVKRRGLIVDVNPETNKARLTRDPDMPAMVRSGRVRNKTHDPISGEPTN
jgi:predicted transcriptional regulator